MHDIAIKVENLCKIYPIFYNKSDRIKEALSISRTKYHNDFYALNGIDFHIRNGETIGIIGHNGSGKSTLLKILSGVLSQTSGNVEINGKVSALLELGAGFNPEMTGLENIYLNGTIMGYKREEMREKIEPIIKFADIGEFIHQPVKMYSSGMFARLAFAVSINVEPDILIIDEALSVGDIFFQNKCYKKLEELKERKTTIIMVTHDLDSVRQMCSKVLWLEKGRQRMFGEKTSVCTAYFNEQVQLQNLLYSDEPIQNKSKDLQKKYLYEEKYKVPAINLSKNSVLSEEAEIISTFISNEYDEIVTDLNADSLYTVSVIAKFHRKLDNTIVGFIIEDRRGVYMLGYNTFVEEKSTFKVKEGIIKVDFSFIMPRIPTGEYLISPAVAVGSQEQPIIKTWIHAASSINVYRKGYNLSIIGADYHINITEIGEVQVYQR
jgi:teichoic acid transport system ATP-binding protein